MISNSETEGFTMRDRVGGSSVIECAELGAYLVLQITISKQLPL